MIKIIQGETANIDVKFDKFEQTPTTTSIRAHFITKDEIIVKFAELTLEPTLSTDEYGSLVVTDNTVTFTLNENQSKGLAVGYYNVHVARIDGDERKEYITPSPVLQVNKGYVLLTEIY